MAVAWLIPQRVIYFNMEGAISYEVFSETNAAVAALLPTGQSPIHLIADMQDVTKFLLDVRWISNKTAIRDGRVAYVCVVGTQFPLKLSTEAVRLFTRSKIQIFPRIEAACEKLFELDKSLWKKELKRVDYRRKTWRQVL